MRITVIIPSGLAEISNGRLLSRTELPSRRTKYVCYVDYPIPSYDVAINTMEHQGAVSIGSMNRPFGSRRYDRRNTDIRL